MGSNGNMVVGLDIGTSKISAIIGEKTSDGIDVVGIGTHPSTGLKKGIIVDIESTIDSIRKAVKDAEKMAEGAKFKAV